MNATLTVVRPYTHSVLEDLGWVLLLECNSHLYGIRSVIWVVEMALEANKQKDKQTKRGQTSSHPPEHSSENNTGLSSFSLCCAAEHAMLCKRACIFFVHFCTRQAVRISASCSILSARTLSELLLSDGAIIVKTNSGTVSDGAL